LGLAAFAAITASKHPKLGALRTLLGNKAQALYSNAFDAALPARRRPLSTIELEERLKSNILEPFGSFSQRDWDWFWDLLYKRYTVDASVWPKRKRQLTRQEIEAALSDNYIRPFGSFGQRHWSIFWQQTLKGQVFK
jgi:hypothetical protein